MITPMLVDAPVSTSDALDLSCIQRWPSEKAQRWTEEFASAALQDERIDALIAIGSSVRPRAATSADVDLVVLYHGVKPRLSAHPIDVDVRTFRSDEVEEVVRRGNDLVVWAICYGRIVFERRRFWSDLVAEWADRLPLPSVSLTLERAARAQARVSDLLGVGDHDAALEQLVTMLTHLARARLLRASVHPASRPELPAQLREIGETLLATQLADALRGDPPPESWLHGITLPTATAAP